MSQFLCFQLCEIYLIHDCNRNFNKVSPITHSDRLCYNRYLEISPLFRLKEENTLRYKDGKITR